MLRPLLFAYNSTLESSHLCHTCRFALKYPSIIHCGVVCPSSPSCWCAGTCRMPCDFGPKAGLHFSFTQPPAHHPRNNKVMMMDKHHNVCFLDSPLLFCTAFLVSSFSPHASICCLVSLVRPLRYVVPLSTALSSMLGVFITMSVISNHHTSYLTSPFVCPVTSTNPLIFSCCLLFFISCRTYRRSPAHETSTPRPRAGHTRESGCQALVCKTCGTICCGT